MSEKVTIYLVSPEGDRYTTAEVDLVKVGVQALSLREALTRRRAALTYEIQVARKQIEHGQQALETALRALGNVTELEDRMRRVEP